MTGHLTKTPAGPDSQVGSRLLDLVALMDRLRRECPWDQEQTHRSLVRHLLEETYEAIEALEAGTREDVREELGDLLVQVLFHARIAQEDPVAPWTIDDVADGVVAKLINRHPHVFADTEVADASEVEVNWEMIKASEKGRSSPLDGVPLALPALALADKVLARLERAGMPVATPEAPQDLGAQPTPEAVGAALLAVVRSARSAGIDPEQALRDTIRAIHASATANR